MNPAVKTLALGGVTFLFWLLGGFVFSLLECSDVYQYQDWDFADALYFSAATMTTIGYGDLYPTTTGGRVFFIFYAITGIILYFSLVCTIAARLGEVATAVSRRSNLDATSPYIFVSIIIVVGTVVLFFIPAGLLAIFARWNYLTSLYFSVVTFSTVGFGDIYLIGQAGRLCLFIWVFLAHVWFALIIARLMKICQDSEHVGHAKDRDHHTVEKAVAT